MERKNVENREFPSGYSERANKTEMKMQRRHADITETSKIYQLLGGWNRGNFRSGAYRMTFRNLMIISSVSVSCPNYKERSQKRKKNLFP